MPRTVRSRVARLALACIDARVRITGRRRPGRRRRRDLALDALSRDRRGPGRDASFDISVKTATRRHGSASRSGKVPDGWTAVLHGGGFTIDGVQSPGGNTETKVTLNVTVPADATGGSQKIDVKGTTASGASHDLDRGHPGLAGSRR